MSSGKRPRDDRFCDVFNAARDQCMTLPPSLQPVAAQRKLVENLLNDSHYRELDKLAKELNATMTAHKAKQSVFKAQQSL